MAKQKKEKSSLLPLDCIELMGDELMFVHGGSATSGASSDSGCDCNAGKDCGCDCSAGKGCGCGCGEGSGCGCGCTANIKE